MNTTDVFRRKQALLARYLDGEINKQTYDQMLAQLEALATDSTPGGDWQDSHGAADTIARNSPSALGAGLMLGGFRLDCLIGRGGMGEVWKAWDPTGNRFVVVKLVPRDIQNAVEEMARVKSSFERVQSLHHQHICPLYILGDDKQRGFFLVMQYVEGQTLSAYRRSFVAQHGSFPLEQVVRVLKPVAAALDYAHSHKIIHRDVKPQNILVVGDAADVQLVDFGLAAEIRTSMSRVSNISMNTSGTRPYMAPEQWRGEHQDGRTDQYALGVVAYELLSGRLPFESEDFDILRACVLNDPAPRVPEQPEHVDWALARAMAKRRTERFDSCRDFISMLTKPAIVASPPAAVSKPPVANAPTGDKLITNSIGMKLALIPAGEFMMGSPETEAERSDDERQHRVPITGPFYLGVYAVTQEEYEAVMGTNPSYFSSTGDGKNDIKGLETSRFPVENVSWEDATEFCRKLSQKEGKKYRLPTEAEWEYACRAGTTTPFNFGNSLNGDNANCDGNYPYGTETKGKYIGRPTTVGSYNANAFGLYDMHGNVYQWCQDWYDEGYCGDSLTDNPSGPTKGADRVVRGGSWDDWPVYCRSALRYWGTPAVRGYDLGFRVARVPGGE